MDYSKQANQRKRLQKEVDQQRLRLEDLAEYFTNCLYSGSRRRFHSRRFTVRRVHGNY